MPSIRTNVPTVIHTAPASPKKERAVGFSKDPVEGVSRPVNTTESWAAYHFEMHARNCAYCHDAYEVHRSREQLCEIGHRLAQEVARFIYMKSDGETYSTIEENHKLVRVEVPSGYIEVNSLLKAIERSLRHRSRTPFVSLDRTYYIKPRTITATPQRSRSVKLEQYEPKPKIKTIRPRSGEIVDWPAPAPASKPVPQMKIVSQSKPKRALAEITNTNAKRGSLYEEDMAKQRRLSKHYAVEVREPTARDLRQHRLASAGYYR